MVAGIDLELLGTLGVFEPISWPLELPLVQLSGADINVVQNSCWEVLYGLVRTDSLNLISATYLGETTPNENLVLQVWGLVVGPTTLHCKRITLQKHLRNTEIQTVREWKGLHN